MNFNVLAFEKLLKRLNGVHRVYVNPATEEAYSDIDPTQVQYGDLVRAIEKSNFRAGHLKRSA